MSTRPRTPQYFPAMKVRGARRRRLAPFQRMRGAFAGKYSLAATTDALTKLTTASLSAGIALASLMAPAARFAINAAAAQEALAAANAAQRAGIDQIKEAALAAGTEQS